MKIVIINSKLNDHTNGGILQPGEGGTSFLCNFVVPI